MNEEPVKPEATIAAAPPMLEDVLSRVLTVSVLVAAVIAVAGGAMYLYTQGGERPNYGEFVGSPAGLTRPGPIVRGAMGLDPVFVIQLGVLCLIATPVIRVVFSLVMFLAKKDGLYVAVTMIVLAALAVGLWGGVA